MTSRPRPRALAFASILAASSLAAAAPALAQDAHYWTYGYGPIGQLTEGTIVGGVNDLSAVFYNPGATALIEKPRFTFTLTSVELASITAPERGRAPARLRQHHLRRGAGDDRGPPRQPRREGGPLRFRVPLPPRHRLGPRVQRRPT